MLVSSSRRYFCPLRSSVSLGITSTNLSASSATGTSSPVYGSIVLSFFSFLSFTVDQTLFFCGAVADTKFHHRTKALLVSLRYLSPVMNLLRINRTFHQTHYGFHYQLLPLWLVLSLLSKSLFLHPRCAGRFPEVFPDAF